VKLRFAKYCSAIATGSMLALSGCSAIDLNPDDITNQAEKLASIQIAAEESRTQVAVNEPLQLTASGTSNRGLAFQLGTVTWESSDASKATIDSNGLVTGRATGNVTLTARSQDISATYTLKIQGALHASNITENETWRASDNPHRVTARVSVGSSKNPMLVIEPGVRVEFARDADLEVGVSEPGGIQVNGTAEAIVLFTADVATPQKGHYSGFVLGVESLGASKVSHLEMEWANHPSGIGREGCLQLQGETTKPVLDTVTVRNCAVTGVELGDGARFGAGSKNLHVEGSDLNAMLFDHNADAVGSIPPGSTFVDNYRNVIHLYAGLVSHSQTWLDFGVPYVLEDEVDVYGPGTPVLTLTEGLTLRFASDAHLDIGNGVNGVLKAIGTEQKPIIFTADADEPQAGHWAGITFHRDSTGASRLTWAVVEYAGATGSAGDFNVRVHQDKGAFITHTTIRHSNACGILRMDTEQAGFPTDFTSAAYDNHFEDNAGGDQCGPQ
jgi:hypothetical protein